MRRVLIWSAVGALGVVSGLVYVAGGGISAVHGSPRPFEARVAKAGWRFLVPRQTRDAANPVLATPSVLKEAREHWADHCAVCHDNNGSGDTTIGRRVYPRAPDLRAARTQQLTDGELFYAIEQGIPWTAMPGWTNGTAEGERASWALVRFIRHLPALTADELNEMERLNPRPPVNQEDEKAIEDFLKGPATKGPR